MLFVKVKITQNLGENNAVSQSRNSWVVRIILGLAIFAFIGVSLLPIISGLSLSQSSENPSNNNTNLSAEDEIRGYESILQKNPENPEALEGLIKARLKLLNQKPRGTVTNADIQPVIEPLEKLVKLKPQDSRFGVLLAQAKQQIGDKEGAAQVYRSILQLKPGDLKALQGMVQLQISEKRPEAAIGLLKETLATAEQANAIKPDSIDIVDVQILLGNVYVYQKDYTQAASTYDQVIKKKPQDFRPVLAKAMLLKQQGNSEEAKPLFDNALALAPAEVKDQIKQLASSPTPTASPTPSP